MASKATKCSHNYLTRRISLMTNSCCCHDNAEPPTQPVATTGLSLKIVHTSWFDLKPIIQSHAARARAFVVLCTAEMAD
jgi:hypothetical protein